MMTTTVPKSQRRKPSGFVYATVPKLFDHGTIVCIGGGPSLTQADVDYVREKSDAVIAINNGYIMAPWAAVLYACDQRWWAHHKGVPSFGGLKYALQTAAARWPGVQVLNNTGTHGLERKPNGLRTGSNGGFQAINLAVHLGASRIILLGYDMQKTGNKHHWHPDHPNWGPPPLHSFIPKFHSLIEPLRELGVTVINCSRETALRAFPRMRLEDALP